MNKENTVPISVIIPVYNVADYLTKCLNSVVNQSMDSSNYEVIIINDGSTDNCTDIINSFVKDNDNFKVITTENSGLSAARNLGIKEARGEYISFIDGDDFWEYDFLKCMYEKCVNNKADIAYCAYNRYFAKINKKFYVPFALSNRVIKNNEALKHLIKDVFVRYYAWNKLYKRTLFTENNIEFPNMYFEDISTIPKLFYYAKKVVIIHKALCNYTDRSNSILGSMNIVKINDYIKAYGSIRNFLEKQNDLKFYKNSIAFVGIKIMICDYYSIIRFHLIEKNFSNFFTNIKNSNKSILYFMNDEFKPYDDAPFLPYPLITPDVNIKKNK